MKRMILHKLTLSGDGKKNATITFNKGLNVISGDSDTGKTYAFQCIDYMLGKENPPKEIIEAKGYNLCELGFYVDEVYYTLTRKLGDKKIFAKNHSTKTCSNLSCKHDAKNPNNISRFLLNILLEKSDNIKIWKKKNKEKRTLSFRDLVHLCLISETDIIAESSAFQSIQYTEKTARASILKYLITGQEESQLEEKNVDYKKVNREGIISYLEVKKTEIYDNIVDIENDNTFKFYTENSSLQEAIVKIQDLRTELSALHKCLSSLNESIAQLNANCFEDEIKLSEFQKLDEYYDIELNKISAISTYQDFKIQLPNLPCPFCKQRIEPAALDDDDITKLYEYWGTSQQELQEKKEELNLSIKEIESRLQKNKENLESLQKEQHNLKSKISNRELELNNFSELISKMREYDEMNCTLKILKSEYLTVLKAIDEYKQKPNREKQDMGLVSCSQYDKYCDIISKILKSWGIVENPQVNFDINNLDLIINGKDRISWGKGYRAVIMTAMAIGLMRYCFEYNRLHPGFVIVDSPLVSLKERKKSDDKWIDTYMEKKMIEDILNAESQRQVIIFENKDLKFDFDYNYIEFNHDGELKGFIP